jgi:hypothetical protein
MKSLPNPVWRLLGSLAVIAFASLVSAQPPVVGKDAEWNPSAKTISRIKQQCAEKSAPDFGKCFVNSMSQAGASPQAVAFARSTENAGYLARFVKMGRVDLAYVHYPFRANENQGWLLVNGDPAMIDVDDFALLPKDQLETNQAFLRIKEKFPKVMLFGGDRSLKQPPKMIALSGKGQRFVVEYRLLNGCHACERVGGAQFAFDFDADGKFLGTTLLDVQ